MQYWLVVACILGIAAPVLAQDDEGLILTHREVRFVNSRCEATSTCDLRNVQFVAENYKNSVEGNDTYGTRMFAAYETATIHDLEHYAFVQFIRGCHYGTTATYVLRHRIYHFGEFRPFLFPHWVIDSDSEDPIYSSWQGKGSRFRLLHWNQETFSFVSDTERSYTEERPSFPRAYISDYPSEAYKINDLAQNAAMEFMVCLYRTSEVPRQIRDTSLTFAQPLACFEWSSSFMYDHNKEKFESPVGIAACSQVPAP